MEEKTVTGAPRQLVSFILDNSASCSKETLSALMGGFRRFGADPIAGVRLEWELISFDTFEPAVCKTFDSPDIAPVRAGRMPLLGRAIDLAVDRVDARAAMLRQNGENCYRPWVFILSSGFTFDETEQAVMRLDAMEHNGDVLYLPFKFSPKLYTERLQTLDRVKHMITVKEGGVEGFFAFVSTMLERRGALAPDAGLKFRKTDFEGWAEL